MARATYELVRFRHGDRSRGVFLRNTRLGTHVLVGTEVDKTGDEVHGKGFDERTRIIDLRLIISRRRYHMDNKYGWLVPGAGPA